MDSQAQRRCGRPCRDRRGARPRRRRLFAVAAAVAVLTVACTPDDAPPAGPELPADDPAEDARDETAEDTRDDRVEDEARDETAALFDEIVEQVAELRELPVEAEVPLEIVGSEEMIELALADAEDDLESIARSEAVAKALHQIPEDADLLELNEELVEAGVAGLYRPSENRAYVVGDGDGLSPLEQVTVAHEVVHALQDQFVDLTVLEEFDDDPDARMAFTSVIEGDAVRLQEQWAAGHLTEQERQERMAEEQRIGQEQFETLQALPRALLEHFVTPYVAGPEFVAVVTRDVGLPALDEALEDPPTTMVEIFDPSLYEEGFSPEPVEVGAAPDGYSQLADWTWGAFEVALLLELAEGHSPAPELTSAWRGGRLAAFEDGDEVAVAVAWTFVDEVSAGRVCEAVPDWYATVADGQPADGQPADGGGVFEAADDALVLECSGTDVSFALGQDVEVARAALGG